MSHAVYHAQSSARRFGGHPDDYIAIHEWFDASKAFIADARHRALRHHAQGIFWCEETFGRTITNSAGRQIPVRLIGEQHVIEDFRRIPTLDEWFKLLPLQEWMYLNVTVLPKTFRDGTPLPQISGPTFTNLEKEKDSLMAQLAIVNGHIHTERCASLIADIDSARSVETRLIEGQVHAAVLDAAGQLLSENPEKSLPYPCHWFSSTATHSDINGGSS